MIMVTDRITMADKAPFPGKDSWCFFFLALSAGSSGDLSIAHVVVVLVRIGIS